MEWLRMSAEFLAKVPTPRINSGFIENTNISSNTYDRKIYIAIVLVAIRSILPHALVFHHTCLKHLVETIDVSHSNNVLRYDKKG